MTRRRMAALVSLGLLLAACGGGGDGEAEAEAKAAVIDDMVADGISRDTAECFADGIVDEFGLDELEKLGEGAEPSPEVILRTFELLGECGFDLDAGLDAGDGDFDTGDEPFDMDDDIADFRELASPRDSVDGPYTYGEDADLDALWDACEEGSGTACDDLFIQSPFGSEYEAFGNTCGNRLELAYDCTSLDE